MRFPLLSKALAIGAVVLMVAAVLSRIDGLAAERRWRQLQAVQGVEQSLAGGQTLLGPLLLRHCSEAWETAVGEGKARRMQQDKRDFMLAAAPQSLQVEGQARAEARYRGLFKVNGYAGPMQLQARWPSLAALQPQREHAGSQLQCGPVLAMLSVSDVRGLRAARAQVDGESLPVQAGTQHPRHARGLHVVLPEARGARADEPLAMTLSIELVGTARLALVPAAGQTRWSLRSDWPQPSFGGRFLPDADAREITDAGFSARWSVTSLASSAAAEALAGGEICAAPEPDPYDPAGGLTVPTPAAKGQSCLDTLAVSFIDPVNPYVLADRATKYALLFVALTFGCVGLVEVLSRQRVHPVQYALVGLALALFFLLMLSLSEHLAFGIAYAGASAACVALLGFYAAHMLGRRGAGAAFGAGIALLYALLWVLLRMEQAALVVGSVMLFVALAAVMVLTRRVDWYALVEGWRRSAAAPAASADATAMAAHSTP